MSGRRSRLPNVPETMSAVQLLILHYIGRVNTIHVTSPSNYCECTAGRRAAAIFAQKFDALCCLTHVARAPLPRVLRVSSVERSDRCPHRMYVCLIYD